MENKEKSTKITRISYLKVNILHFYLSHINNKQLIFWRNIYIYIYFFFVSWHFLESSALLFLNSIKITTFKLGKNNAKY